MSNFFKMGLVKFLAITFLISCGENSGGNSGGNGDNNANHQLNKPTSANRVNWSAVPSEYNPKTEDVEFRTNGFEKINVDAFGFKDDAEVVYTNEVSAGSGYLRLYKVYKIQLPGEAFSIALMEPL